MRPAHHELFTAAEVDPYRPVAALSYLWLLCLVPFVLRRGNAYVHYHAKQGVALLAVELVGSALLVVPYLNWLVAVGLLAMVAIGLANALTGRAAPLPVIGRVAAALRL